MWAHVVVGDRCVIVTVVLTNCKSDAVGDDVIGVVFEGSRDGQTTCGFQMMRGSSMLATGVGS